MLPYQVIEAGDARHYALDFAGRKVKFSDFPGTLLSVESLANGSYETPLPILLMATVARTSGDFCDVGANIGIYSLLAMLTRSDVHGYAFEPLPQAREALVSNLILNNVLDRVDIRPIALSDTEGVARLYIPSADHGLLETSASIEIDFKAAASSIEVNVRTLDSLSLKRPLSVIKADIEGHEAAFLRGAKKTLTEDRPFVYAEMLSGASKSFFALSKSMSDLGYCIFRMRPDAVIITEIIVEDKGWNYAFIPRERIETFRDCCRAHEIEMLQSY